MDFLVKFIFAICISTPAFCGDVTDIAGNKLSHSVISVAVHLDNTDPIFTISANPHEASIGDVVTISIKTSEEIQSGIDISVNSNMTTSLVQIDWTEYICSYTVLETDPIGPATIYVSGMDIAENINSTTNTDELIIIEQKHLPLGTLVGPISIILLSVFGVVYIRIWGCNPKNSIHTKIRIVELE